jgi:hypothetical protein
MSVTAAFSTIIKYAYKEDTVLEEEKVHILKVCNATLPPTCVLLQ